MTDTQTVNPSYWHPDIKSYVKMQSDFDQAQAKEDYCAIYNYLEMRLREATKSENAYFSWSIFALSINVFILILHHTEVTLYGLSAYYFDFVVICSICVFISGQFAESFKANRIGWSNFQTTFVEWIRANSDISIEEIFENRPPL